MRKEREFTEEDSIACRLLVRGQGGGRCMHIRAQLCRLRRADADLSGKREKEVHGGGMTDRETMALAWFSSDTVLRALVQKSISVQRWWWWIESRYQTSGFPYH